MIIYFVFRFMIPRIANISKTHSFFLFGARGTGKTTLLEERLRNETFLSIDLLDPSIELILTEDPSALKPMIDRMEAALGDIKDRFCIIDEVQKAPKLLDVVHQLIFQKKCLFALTGSSARKLKRSEANMLAGRAFLFNLFPLTHRELLAKYDPHTALQEILTWGSIPTMLEHVTTEDKSRFLNAYINTYLREEIMQEQVVTQLQRFRMFLELAAQLCGEEINFSRLGRQIGVQDTTIKNYFEILESTLLGLFLYPHNGSIKKKLSQAPKFYLFDIGIRRMLANRAIFPAIPTSEEYGRLFEHFVIMEVYRLMTYKELNWELSYIRTHDDGPEIDLVISRPGLEDCFIEIKSTDKLTENHLSGIKKFKKYPLRGRYYCFSRDKHERLVEDCLCLPWDKGLQEIGLG